MSSSSLHLSNDLAKFTSQQGDANAAIGLLACPDLLPRFWAEMQVKQHEKRDQRGVCDYKAVYPIIIYSAIKCILYHDADYLKRFVLTRDARNDRWLPRAPRNENYCLRKRQQRLSLSRWSNLPFVPIILSVLLVPLLLALHCLDEFRHVTQCMPIVKGTWNAKNPYDCLNIMKAWYFHAKGKHTTSLFEY